MKFIEVDCVFLKMLSPEDKTYYTSMYGDDMEDWPDELPIHKENVMMINVENINTFNPSSREGETTLRMNGEDGSYRVKMEYADFKKLINNAVK